ncbi:hypothetical protein HKX48_008405 [Thoreauomyces humboldtii]|nr:hypothetical protein HKX48_008405 [Thoreauomyces humboldtii]
MATQCMRAPSSRPYELQSTATSALRPAPPQPRPSPASTSSTAQSSAAPSNAPWVLPAAFRQLYGTVQDNLGSGGSGHIFSAVRRSDHKEVAVKLLPKSSVPHRAWVKDAIFGCIPREVQTLKSIDHPNVVAFYDLFQDAHMFLIVMELFGSSWRTEQLTSFDPNPLPLATRPTKSRAMDLFELLEVRTLTEDDARTIFIQLVECADHLLSSHALIHGDIKDENVLVDWSGPRPVAKLIDFGSAVALVPYRMCSQRDFRGTVEFASPEVVLGQPYDAEKTETWSLGVLLYGMLNKGSGPFFTPQATAYSPYVVPLCSAACGHLLSRLLTKKQASRADFAEILAHPWILKGKLASRQALPSTSSISSPTSTTTPSSPRRLEE